MMDSNIKIIDALDQINNNYIAIMDLYEEITAITKENTEEASTAVKAVFSEGKKPFDELKNNVEIDSSFIPVFIKRMENTPGLDSYKEIEKWISNNKSLFQEGDSNALINGARVFDGIFNNYVDQVRDIQKRFDQEKDRILAEAEKNLLEATTPKINEIDRLKSENESFDLLHEEYYYLAGDISKILKTRRANNITDALNLAIKEQSEAEYRKSQLQIQTQEAEERNRILKEQAEGEALHNEIMQKIAYERLEGERKHQSEMLAAAEKANELQERQYNDNKRAMEKAEWDERQRNKERLQLQKDLDRATSQWRGYKSQGLEQDAIRWEAEIERIKGKMHSL